MPPPPPTHSHAPNPPTHSHALTTGAAYLLPADNLCAHMPSTHPSALLPYVPPPHPPPRTPRPATGLLHLPSDDLCAQMPPTHPSALLPYVTPPHRAPRTPRPATGLLLLPADDLCAQMQKRQQAFPALEQRGMNFFATAFSVGNTSAKQPGGARAMLASPSKAALRASHVRFPDQSPPAPSGDAAGVKMAPGRQDVVVGEEREERGGLEGVQGEALEEGERGWAASDSGGDDNSTGKLCYSQPRVEQPCSQPSQPTSQPQPN